MSKDKKHEKKEGEVKHEPAPAESGVPKWAVAVGAIMIVAGGALFAAREPMRRSAAVKALTSAKVTVNTIDDGFEDNFATTMVDTNRREYLDVLGACRTDPDFARTVFNTVMKESSTEGRILCCRMSFFMAQDEGDMGRDTGLSEMLKSVAEQLGADRKPELRAQAQWALGQLLAIKDPAKAKEFENLPPAPKDQKGVWLVKTKEETFGDGANAVKIARIRWSNADACLAWWQTFGAKAVWDAKLKRFVLE